MSFLDPNIYCSYCNGKISSKEQTYGHHCLIFTNGIPDVGKNHLKTILEMEEIIRKIIK